MSAGNVARVIAVLAACAAAAGSATSKSSSPQNQSFAGPGSQDSPPPPQQMEASRALGLWRSTFGAVKIDPDDSKGGLDAGSVHGVWVYQRQGQEVVGYFAGNLRGNVLQFHWQEPGSPPLTGEGFLVFDVQGHQYSGRWWSDRRDRVGDWSGWRQGAGRAGGGGAASYEASPYGGQRYGEDSEPAPYRRPQPGSRQPADPPPPYRQPPAQQPPAQQPPAQQQYF